MCIGPPSRWICKPKGKPFSHRRAVRPVFLCAGRSGFPSLCRPAMKKGEPWLAFFASLAADGYFSRIILTVWEKEEAFIRQK